MYFNLNGTLKIERYIPNKNAYHCVITDNDDNVHYTTLPVQLISNMDIREASYKEYPTKKDNLNLQYTLTFEEILEHTWKDRNQEVWRVERFLKNEMGFTKGSMKKALFVNLSHEKDSNTNKYMHLYSSYLYIWNKNCVGYKDPNNLERKDGSNPIRLEKKLSEEYNHYIQRLVDYVNLSYSITWKCKVHESGHVQKLLSYDNFFFLISKLPY